MNSTELSFFHVKEWYCMFCAQKKAAEEYVMDTNVFEIFIEAILWMYVYVCFYSIHNGSDCMWN